MSRAEISDALRKHCKDALVTEMKGLSKLKDKISASDEFEMKPYFKNKNVIQARTMFKKDISKDKDLAEYMSAVMRLRAKHNFWN